MITDIMALARDVDRLFRARQDGRSMPQGDVDPQASLWVPYASEAAAYRLAGLLDGYAWDGREDSVRAFWTAQETFKYFTNTRMHLRTRRHVAMLALTEPDHFKACLTEADQEPDVKLLAFSASACPSRTKIVQRTSGWSRVREIPYPQSKTNADIRRTARYLQVLDARLTEWREAEAVRAAIKERDREIAAEDALAAAAQEPIPQEDEDAILAIA